MDAEKSVRRQVTQTIRRSEGEESRSRLKGLDWATPGRIAG